MQEKKTTRCRFLMRFNQQPNSETAVSELEKLHSILLTKQHAICTSLNNFLIELEYE